MCRVDLSGHYMQVHSAMNDVCEWFCDNLTVLSILSLDMKKLVSPPTSPPTTPRSTTHTPILPTENNETTTQTSNNNNAENISTNKQEEVMPLSEHMVKEMGSVKRVDSFQGALNKIISYKPKLNSPLLLGKLNPVKKPETSPPANRDVRLMTLKRRGTATSSLAWGSGDGDLAPPTQWVSQHADLSVIRAREGWYIEPASTSRDPPPCIITDKDMTSCFYRDYFVSESHFSFIGGTKDDPVFVAVENMQEITSLMGFKALIRTKYGDQCTWISDTSNGKQIIKQLKMEGKDLEEIDNMDLKNEMVNWEERSITWRFKFGIVYCKSGQTTEEDMFNNRDGSLEFEAFLDTFADKIQTKDWEYFTGGLNVKSDLDGPHSRFAFFSGFEIMFHVSTYLKYNANDSQQLERKRHIGNDVVVVVYMEGDQALEPGFIRSHFNHVYIVVKPVAVQLDGPSKTCYRIGVAAKLGVVPFGPYLQDKLYEKEELKTYLLTKLINAQSAAMHAPAFRDRIIRSRQTFLYSLLASYSKSNKS